MENKQLISVALYLDKRFDWRYGFQPCVVVEVGELDDEDELTHLDFVLLAVEHNTLAVERLGNACRGASRSQYIVEERQVERIALRLAGRNVRQTVEYVVGAIFLPFLRVGTMFCTSFDWVSSGAAKRNPRASTVMTLGLWTLASRSATS